MSDWYFQEAGIVRGPIKTKDLKQRLATGVLPMTAPVRRCKRQEWRPANEVKSLTDNMPPPEKPIRVRVGRKRPARPSRAKNILQRLSSPRSLAGRAWDAEQYSEWKRHQKNAANARMLAYMIVGCTCLFGRTYLVSQLVQLVSSAEREDVEYETATPASRLDEANAMVNVKEAVRRRLISPSKASFPWFDVQIKSNHDGTFNISSYVDCQNRFGATLHVEYRATVDAAGNVKFLYLQDDLGNIQVGDGTDFLGN